MKKHFNEQQRNSQNSIQVSFFNINYLQMRKKTTYFTCLIILFYVNIFNIALVNNETLTRDRALISFIGIGAHIRMGAVTAH